MSEQEPAYAWNITVLEYNHYGDRIVRRTPMTVHASTKTEVTMKVRAAFDSTYDQFRKFWTHGWSLVGITELDREPTA